MPLSRLELLLGEADRAAHYAAHKIIKAARIAREELQELSKQVEALKRQLAKSNKRLKLALKQK